MAAHQTVPEVSTHSKSPVTITPSHGVLTVHGYGIRINVQRGHLTIEDGIGTKRRKARLPRVGHGLRRLVIIGSDGFVSLSAFRWLADQHASFVMLERSGSVLATTGPVRPSDARLRRVQSLAHQSDTALNIAKELIRRKLNGQELIARMKLSKIEAADAIARIASSLEQVPSVEVLREFEARAANAYWSAWREIPICFPQSEKHHVPNHWLRFGSRRSILTGSNRLAVNPPNAILNYLYALLESESRLALAALGLDPGLGVMHFDSRTRDSLACDLMEAVRPRVDDYVLDWITRQPLKREWFFEQRDGNCRLMSRFASKLSETSEMWRSIVSPVAEWIVRAFWSQVRKPSRELPPATRLTQAHRSISKGGHGASFEIKALTPPNFCRGCGKALEGQRNRPCASCAKPMSRKHMLEIAKLGRIAAHSAKAEALRSATKRRHDAERKNWKPSSLPDWLTEETYRQKLQPRLAGFPVPKIAAALGISEPYATDIRIGKRVPHPRHWTKVACMVGFSA